MLCISKPNYDIAVSQVNFNIVHINLRTREISLLKNNEHDLHRVITRSLVLVIVVLKDAVTSEWVMHSYFTQIVIIEKCKMA